MQKLSTCDNRLQVLFYEVIKEFDCTILCGHRGEAEQNAAYASGNSKLKYPKSKHNSLPSMAVDVAPYPIDWLDLKRFKELSEVVKKKAAELNIGIVWGGDWKKFPDAPHYELID